MPLIESDKLVTTLDPNAKTFDELNQVEQESPNFWSETLPAAFQLENEVVSGIYNFKDTEKSSNERDDYVPDYTGYEDYADQFAYVFSEAQEKSIKNKINREIENRKILEQSGWLGIGASFAAGALSPTTFLPVGGTANRVYKSGNILKGAAQTASAGLIGSSISEAALQASQQTRTFGESAANIAGATFLSGVLGSAAGALKDRKIAKRFAEIDVIEKNIDEFLTLPEAGQPDIMLGNAVELSKFDLDADVSYKSLIVGEGGDVGAKRVSIAENKLKSVAGLEKIDFSNRIMRTATSDSLLARKYLQELVETPYIYEKNARGIETAVAAETYIKNASDVAEYHLLTSTQKAFEEYTGTTFLRARAGDQFGFAKGRLNFDEFKIEIDKAMRNNDIHKIPAVEKVAKKLRSLVDDVYDEAVKLGLVEKIEGGPKGAPSWMRRVYDRQAIQNNRLEWEKRVKQWFKHKHPEMDDLEIADLVERTTNNVLGTPEDLPIFNLPSSGPFKERVFDIPDELIQDFLIRDIDVNLSGYFKKAIREIELKRAGFDDAGMKEKLSNIANEYAEKVNKSKSDVIKKYEKQISESSGKEKLKLLDKQNKEIASVEKTASKNRDRVSKDLIGMRDRIRGTLQLNSQSILNQANLPAVTETLKTLNYVRLLGGVTLSSIPDIGMPIVINGMTRTFRDQLVPFVRELSSISKKLGKEANASVRAQSIQELKDMGIALDFILNTRINNFAELGSSVTGSKLTTFNAKTSKALTFLSGISVWNDKMKLMSGYSAMARIIRATEAKTLSKSDTEFLARFGIGQDMLKRIRSEFGQHGSKDKGRYASGSNNWTDREAYRTFQGAIRKFVDQTIIVPGQEKPFFASTPWGSVFLQFKSFALSAYSKLFIAGLQQRELSVLNGALSMVGLGMMSFYLKSLISGRDLPEDIDEWVFEGVDKAGLLGHLFDVNQILTKAGAGISNGPVSRYASRSGASAVVGPSFDLLENTFRTGNYMRKFIAEGERPLQSDIHATRRLIPFNNVFILSKLFDKAEEGVGQMVGAKKTKRKKRKK